MGRLGARCLRLAVVTGAIAGSALVSSAVVATDELPPIDESGVSIVDAAPIDTPATDQSVTDQSVTDQSVSDLGTIVVEIPPGVPLEDIAVIEMVVVDDTTDPDVSASEGGEADATTESEVSETAPAAEFPDESGAEIPAAPAVASLEDEDGGSGHEGGSVSGGSPYLMTFDVVWLDPDGNPLGVLDAARPDDWRSLFALSAGSQTGRGMATSATCVYPDGGDALQCVFVNPGHRSDSDGLAIPARPTATYTVTVTWEPAGWNIEGANDGPHSARELCPRGGAHDGEDDHDGHDGGAGHDGHEGEDGSVGEGGERRTFPCVHTVLMRAPAARTPVDPPVARPEVEPIVPVEPAVIEQPAPLDAAGASSPVVEVAPVTAVTPRALPATGTPVSVLLLLGGLLVAAGSAAVRLSRPVSEPDESEV